MPELPEAENIARKLSEKISGKVISDFLLRRQDILKAGKPAEYQALAGQTVLKVGRRAKWVILFFENGCRLWIHLGMTGQLILAQKTGQSHIHVEISFRGLSEILSFRDIRRFGGLFLQSPEGQAPKGIAALGPEPLEMSGQDFQKRLTGRKGRIKNFLLNQRFIAGIGNIYADEILFRAKIHPRKTPGKIPAEKSFNLFRAVQKVLREAIADGGSSIDDYIHPDGLRGKFQEKHRVYARSGKMCFDCASKIRRIILNGRSTCFCPVCQK